MSYETIGASPVEWAGRTAPEVKTRATVDGSVLVVPVGSLEQHGDHLPTITDTLLVSAVAQEGAERAHEQGIPVLRTPTVWTGQSRHHLPFGGTASLDVETLLDVLEGIAETACQNGFDGLVLVNGHGGNIALIQNAVQEIGFTSENTEISGLTYFHLAGEFIDEIRESELGGIAHGGEFETSLMMHLRPDLVDEEAITATPHSKVYTGESKDLFDTGYHSVHRSFDAYTESGAVGRPDLATETKGAELFDRLGEAFRDLLVEVHENNR